MPTTLAATAFRPIIKKILAHENCVTWQKKVAEQAAATPPAAGAPAPTPPVYADATFKDTWTVDFGGENVHVRYFGPGHTSGDAVIFFEKANVMHAGDLLFRRVHPRVDSPAGASVVNWLDQSCRRCPAPTAATRHSFSATARTASSSARSQT